MSHNLDIAIGVILVVATVSFALAILAVLAWRRTGNARLGFVTAAFFVFGAKSVLTSYSLKTGFIAHEDLELVNSLGDLLAVLLLLAPFAGALLRRRP